MAEEMYKIVQDGMKLEKSVDGEFKDFFDYRDIKSNKDGNYINFVGFIFTPGRTLVSFPKHYFSNEELYKINKSRKEIEYHVEILYKLIKKNIQSKNRKLINVKREINLSYPFSSFLEAYRYFQSYGLFTQESEGYTYGYHGKILWKDTFRKSPIVYNKGNILYIPPVVRKRKNDFVFVSKCMAYIINITLKKFKFLFDYTPVSLEYRDIDFSNNKMVISKLRLIKMSLFKDIHLKLIESLISFFENENYNGSKNAIKIYSFHTIWELMIREMLNKYFSHIDNTNGTKLIFNKNNLKQYDFINKSFKLDARRNVEGIKTYSIKPDYFCDTNNIRYIFDAKYYTDITEMDYKQISYYFLLKDFKNEQEKIYNILILPTSNKQYNKTHFKLDDEYTKERNSLKIEENYLNMYKVIKIYLKM